MPWMNADCRIAGSSTAIDVGEAAVQLLEQHPDLAPGQVGARQKCGPPPPYPKCGLGFRVTSKQPRVVELGFVAVGRVVPHHDLVAAFIGTPPISMSSVAVRRMKMTGVAQRTISSTAVGGDAVEIGPPGARSG